MISISLPQNMMIKDSSVIHNDEQGRSLHNYIGLLFSWLC